MSFHCAQCERAIDIESSSELIESTVTEFNNSLIERNNQLNNQHINKLDQNAISKLNTALHDSFIILSGHNKQSAGGDRQVISTSEFYKQINTITNINDIVSGIIDLTDYYTDNNNKNANDQCSLLCDKCFEKIRYEYDKLIKSINDDCNLYEKYINALNGNDTAQQFYLPHMYTPHERQQIDTQLHSVQQNEIELLQQLKSINNEKIEMHNELQKIETDYSELMQQEYNYITEYNAIQSELQLKQSELSNIQSQINYTTELLSKLKSSNVYNDVFYITFDGTFGTINNQRLGRLSTQSVQWNEINGALGDIVLACCVIAKKINYTYHTYKLNPMGSYTTISLLSDPTHVCELYSNSDLSLRKLFRYGSGFDQALIWLLHCIDQLQQYIHNQCDNTFEIKYIINDDKIGNISIKTAANNDQQWSRACKFLLINMKFMLAWISKLPHPARVS